MPARTALSDNFYTNSCIHQSYFLSKAKTCIMKHMHKISAKHCELESGKEEVTKLKRLIDKERQKSEALEDQKKAAEEEKECTQLEKETAIANAKIIAEQRLNNEFCTFMYSFQKVVDYIGGEEDTEDGKPRMKRP